MVLIEGETERDNTDNLYKNSGNSILPGSDAGTSVSAASNT
jgi:hypothetical protein